MVRTAATNRKGDPTRTYHTTIDQLPESATPKEWEEAADKKVVIFSFQRIMDAANTPMSLGASDGFSWVSVRVNAMIFRRCEVIPDLGRRCFVSPNDNSVSNEREEGI